VAVHEVEMGAGIEQALRLVLPVHHGQERRQLAQRVRGHQRAVDGGAALAGGLHLPPDDDLVVVRGQAETLDRLAGAPALDHRLHHGAVGAGPDELARSARAEDQPERIDEDGLAGAGFAGEEGQPRPQLQLGARDERYITDPEQFKHLEARCGGG
jgi:hypothetical protein